MRLEISPNAVIGQYLISSNALVRFAVIGTDGRRQFIFLNLFTLSKTLKIKSVLSEKILARL